jgi:hypothetical protein
VPCCRHWNPFDCLASIETFLTRVQLKWRGPASPNLLPENCGIQANTRENHQNTARIRLAVKKTKMFYAVAKSVRKIASFLIYLALKISQGAQWRALKLLLFCKTLKKQILNMTI